MTLAREGGRQRAVAAQEPVPLLLRDLVHERIGIHFEADRLDEMLEKLEPRALARRCGTFLDYYYILKYDDPLLEEWRRVMDAFSVLETYFWREVDQVNALVKHIVPGWFQRSTGPLRIWSAACASGEEPYTIAMALCEAGWGGHPFEIVGSDASELALQKARNGIYRERSFRSIPPALQLKYFQRQGDEFALSDSIKSRVSFRWANLLDPSAFADLAPHVIFCRNVFIYFSGDSIRRVVRSFANKLPSAGHLFVGASESLLKLTQDFELVEIGGAFVYVRKAR